jgi:hypothetical protein
MNAPNPGSLIEDIALAPVTAAERLEPGQHVGLAAGSRGVRVSAQKLREPVRD